MRGLSKRQDQPVTVRRDSCHYEGIKQEAGSTCDREEGQLVIMRGLSKRQGQPVTMRRDSCHYEGIKQEAGSTCDRQLGTPPKLLRRGRIFGSVIHEIKRIL
jgi:hypothetical protein